MRAVVVTSCTGEKRATHDRALTLGDFERGPSHVAAREAELTDLLTPAEDLYTGQQHVRLMRGVRTVRNRTRGRAVSLSLDLWVLSAGYGLVNGPRRLAPYECTFQGMKRSALRNWADQLNVPSEIRKLLAAPYDLGLLLLGDAYLEACALDDAVVLGGPTLLFCGAHAATRLPKLEYLRPVVLGNTDAKRFSCGLVGLKGELAARILKLVGRDPSVLAKLWDPTVDILDLLDPRETLAVRQRATSRPNPGVDRVIEIPEPWWKKPHRERLSYFIPEWDDLVDPDYDFETDTHSGGAGDWSNEVYAHQLYPEPNYDGILISKVVAEKSRKKKERINALGVHRFVRVPRAFPVMGDCGAFGYIQAEMPPYTTDEILDYYTRLDFDFGVSIDHLIVTATDAQKQLRYELTIHNAEEFLREHGKRGLTWQPVGAVQGWDPPSYAQAARHYVAMGYRYIGLGGLVRTSTPEILRILEAVHQVVPDTISIHLFGLARLHAIQAFSDLGVRSVDSASYLRQAWMRTAQSYLLGEEAYSALRIPEVGKSFRAKRLVSAAALDEEQVQGLERTALGSVRALARRECSVETCLNAVLEYDRYVTKDRIDMTQLYKRTLEERPWERCECGICRSAGVEVIIFRGNNRNRRRGFHNTFVFYRRLQELVLGPASTSKWLESSVQLILPDGLSANAI